MKARININIAGMDPKKNKIVSVPLDFLPKRPLKSRKIKFSSRFLDNKVINLEISDVGFGDMYPATDAKRSIEVNIWD